MATIELRPFSRPGVVLQHTLLEVYEGEKALGLIRCVELSKYDADGGLLPDAEDADWYAFTGPHIPPLGKYPDQWAAVDALKEVQS